MRAPALRRLQLDQIELEARLRAIEAANAPTGDNTGADEPVARRGDVKVGDEARVYGPTVGLNLGKIIYGRDVDEDERRRIERYLDNLANRLYRLPLRGIRQQIAHRIDDLVVFDAVVQPERNPHAGTFEGRRRAGMIVRQAQVKRRHTVCG